MAATSRFTLALVLATLTACAPAVAGDNGAASVEGASALQRVPLEIQTAKKALRYEVEVAATPDEQARGLMFRTSLPSMGGMIFLMRTPDMATFWMKDTVIPLDMIFIRTDGTIARIAANAVPESLEVVSSGEPVSAVLEIIGGGAAAAGIAEGDRVIWRQP
jgi:uncharacterized membrane protein (UPF0127 family)